VKKPLEPADMIGEKVQVYRNLHQNQGSLCSLRHAATRLVAGYAECVVLQDCRFKVSEAGRQRVIREKRKNVHATIEGTLTGYRHSDDMVLRGLTYNPYENRTFVYRDTGKPVKGAQGVLFLHGRAYEIVERRQDKDES
jgi:hypothetical protein